MNLRPHIASAIALFAVMLCGCAPGKGPFLMVQICLGNEEGLKEFKDRMRSIAQSEHMTLVDGSSYTKKDLEMIGALRQAGPIIHIEVEREDTLGLTATNLGLPGYQIVIGFSEDPNPTEARAFAKRVVDLLKTQWQVETVPSGKGALPLKSCGTPQDKH